jgi:hypothetical protein
MTKDEFFAKRAIERHVKTHGVTKCLPASAETLSVTFAGGRPRGGRRRDTVRSAATRMVHHPIDRESGEALPIQFGGSIYGPLKGSR